MIVSANVMVIVLVAHIELVRQTHRVTFEPKLSYYASKIYGLTPDVASLINRVGC
jgi:hypothetical protein